MLYYTRTPNAAADWLSYRPHVEVLTGGLWCQCNNMLYEVYAPFASHSLVYVMIRISRKPVFQDPI